MNEAITASRLVQLLGARGAMSDLSLFVGRSYQLGILDGVAQSPHNCAWLFGPARNGKSSLARKVAERARSCGKRVAVIDASDIDGGDFKNLLARAVQSALGAAPSPSDAEIAFRDLAITSSKEPLLVVFDEFDRHAVQLGLNEQAFLRSLKETYAALNYLFISRLNPKYIVEDVSDERSRLLGLCGVPVHVPVFSREDILRLCEHVARAFGLDCQREWAERLIVRVGGHPAAVMDVLHHTAVSLLEGDPHPGALDEALDRHGDHLGEVLRRHWRDLHGACRAFLLTGQGSDRDKSCAEREGYWNRRRAEALRPELLLEVGAQEDSGTMQRAAPSGPISNVAKLHYLIDRVNTTLNRCGQPDAFVLSTEILRYHQLARPIAAEADFHASIDHLSKVVYEAGRERKPGRDASPEDWRIADVEKRETFRNSNALRMLVELRVYYDHDERKQPVKRETKIGDWFELSCGSRIPAHAAQFEQAREYLLLQLIKALEHLAVSLEPVCSP